jgi:molecular chaperone GrpE
MTKKKTPHGDQSSPQQPAPSSDIELLTLKLKDAEQKLSQMTELGKRAVADMENMRRRMEEDRSRMMLFANVELIKELLPIIDNLRRANSHLPKEIPEQLKGYIDGIIQISNQLEKALEKQGVKKIEAAGKPFNPTFHEAITMAKGPKDTVIEVLEEGFTLGSHVIRPAKVKIGAGE